MEGSPRSGHVQHWYLKEWRRYRRLTQQSLADKMETTKGTISKLEGYQAHGPGPGHQMVNDEWLGRFCLALGVTQRELSGHPSIGKPLLSFNPDVAPPYLTQSSFNPDGDLIHRGWEASK
jgi:hypothetical protein